MLSFARTGRPPGVRDQETLRSLAEQHVVALGPEGAVLMAHAFAAHRDGTRVTSGDREWWGQLRVGWPGDRGGARASGRTATVWPPTGSRALVTSSRRSSTRWGSAANSGDCDP